MKNISKILIALIISVIAVISVFTFGCNKNQQNTPGQTATNTEQGSTDTATQDKEPEDNNTDAALQEEEPEQEPEQEVVTKPLVVPDEDSGYVYNEAGNFYEKEDNDLFKMTMVWGDPNQTIHINVDGCNEEDNRVLYLSCDGGSLGYEDRKSLQEKTYTKVLHYYGSDRYEYRLEGSWLYENFKYIEGSDDRPVWERWESITEPGSFYIQIIIKNDEKIVGYGLVNAVYTGEEIYLDYSEEFPRNMFGFNFCYALGTKLKSVTVFPENEVTEEQVKAALEQAIEEHKNK